MSHPPATAVALFSGGLDSILAVKLVQEQGLHIICLHFTSPFFGNPDKIARWRKEYGLDIRPVDISSDFACLLAKRPKYGFGSVLNPCIDCKILMARRAGSIMEQTNACAVISGEVLGQRPMSQRRDALNIIRRDAELKGRLLRPLCALRLDPTQAEIDGRIDRSRLLGLSGRGRKAQLALAERFQLRDIPAPAGGCRLTEKENARSYWPVLQYVPTPGAKDFALANTGRQYWHISSSAQAAAYWLTIGRNDEDNMAIMALAEPGDLLFKVRDFPGPIALGRRFGVVWPAEVVRAAAAFTASYSPKAVRNCREHQTPVDVRVHEQSLDAPGACCREFPTREPAPHWRECSWDKAREEIRAEAKDRTLRRSQTK